MEEKTYWSSNYLCVLYWDIMTPTLRKVAIGMSLREIYACTKPDRQFIWPCDPINQLYMAMVL